MTLYGTGDWVLYAYMRALSSLLFRGMFPRFSILSMVSSDCDTLL